MPLYWANTGTWSSTSADTVYWVPVTTTAYDLWRSQGTTTSSATADAYYYMPQSQQGRAVLAAYSGLGQQQAFRPQSPAVMMDTAERERIEAMREQNAYQRALAQHDEQEAARVARRIAMRGAEAEERRRRVDQQYAERDAARQRANDLLLQHLTPEQRETFVANGWFVVEGGKTKTRYRIRAVESMVANVDVLDNDLFRTDKVLHRLCGHVPTHKVPLGDQLLAQKMMLEFAENDFLRIANRHGP